MGLSAPMAWKIYKMHRVGARSQQRNDQKTVRADVSPVLMHWLIFGFHGQFRLYSRCRLFTASQPFTTSYLFPVTLWLHLGMHI